MMMTFFKKRLGLILLTVSVIIGLLIFKDYGISWDEPGSHEIGSLNYDYIFSGSKQLLSYPEKDYGIAFELPLIFIEKILGLEDSRSIYLARHLVTHLFFLISAYICFLLIDLLYKNKTLASIGFLLLVLNPLLYAHSFFNSKDIPFMGMFIICFYLNALAFKNKTKFNFIVLGIATGLLINMRIIGIMMAGISLLFLILDSVQNRTALRKNIKLALLFCSTFITILYVSWPYLWAHPFNNFILAVKHMSDFSWYFDVLFNGISVSAKKLRWYYFPVWFGITTPLVYLFSGLISIVFLVFRLFREPVALLKNTVLRNNFMFLMTLASPVLAVIILHSTLYDSWRHLFFIYPSFLLISIYGLHTLYKTKAKKFIIPVMAMAFIFSGYFIISNHPYQHLYFNQFVDTKKPEYLRSQYELDYWGTSYKQSLEYILTHDNSESINVAFENEPGWYNLAILVPAQRNRIHLTDVKDADYFITNYRWHPSDYPEFRNMEWHSIKINNNTINSIFKLR